MNRIVTAPAPRRPLRRLVGWATVALALVASAILVPAIVTTAASLGTAAGSGGAEGGGVSASPTSADGLIPEGHPVSVFDDTVPAVTKLNPDLLAAVRKAAWDAGPSIRFVVNSGWRSPLLQQYMLQQAVGEYGSTAEAERWVATPEGSEHVKGDAVDIGPWAADDWLARHGAAYGLCQIYANEAWHFELRPDAPKNGCPAMYADPAHDPRLQK
jgi:hypothetical protein